ncbi:MAG TPA: DUF2130 domain-containing protein [Pirellulaceae bacterium]|jgi:hypothetical protein|nr:DUF2130 domain-containing protein [Pirellulaceae bacterium]
MSDTITCPSCNYQIEVGEVLSAQLRIQLQKEFEAEIRTKEAGIAEREKAVAKAQADVSQAKEDVSRLVSEQLIAERKKLSAELLERAREQVTLEIADKDQQLAAATSKLKEAQDTELALRKERRELQEAKENLALTLTRQLDEERTKIREAAKKEADQELQLKEAEKNKLISDLRIQLDDMKRRAEQGSQQSQGEILELVLEDLLRQQFPFDEITPVPKGVHGGDVVQLVRDAAGVTCGIILWESKRTKNWSDGWLPKFRDDQRAAKAQIAILVSVELPKNVKTFGQMDGVWVCSMSCAVNLAHALRCGLLEIGAAKRSLEGRSDKMELLYQYLASQEFRHRVEGIVEAFTTLRDDLEAEKRSTQRMWAKREKQLDRAVSQTAGLYGDLSGIMGAVVPRIDQLETPRLDGPDEAETEEKFA